MNLDTIINKAKELDSYFITITTRDGSKEEGDLNHYYFKKRFAQDDVIPALDESVRLLDVFPEKPVDVVKSKRINDDKKPLKIAIISHFNSMPESYSPARAVRNQIKMLKAHGHEVSMFIREDSRLTEEELGCTLLKVMPKFKREKMIVNEEMKKVLIDIFKTKLAPDFDIAITHDFYIQDTVTYSEAIRECGINIPWLHFARSGVGHEMDFSMDNANFVYLNYADIGPFARAIKVKPEQCRTVFNEKEPSYMFDWDPITKMIVDKFELWDRDIIQTYPICSTRMDAKGINSVIKTFVELKRLGKKVALIIPNANGRKRSAELIAKQQFAKKLGLNEDEIIFTSLLATKEYRTESGLPNKVCAELMQMSNLFIFPTIAEVGPNIVLEASMTKNLIVINSDLPLMYDFVEEGSYLEYPFTSCRSLHYSGRDDKSLAELAEKIVTELDSNKIDKQFRRVWRVHNSESIYRDMLEPILYKNIK